MKRIVLAIVLALTAQVLPAQDSLYVNKITAPLLIDKPDNLIFELMLDSKDGKGTLNSITLEFNTPEDIKNVTGMRVYYCGSQSILSVQQGSIMSYDNHANPAYTIKKFDDNRLKRANTLTVNQTLFPGKNYFAVAIQMNPKTPLDTKIGVRISAAIVNGNKIQTVDNDHIDNFNFKTGYGFRDISYNYALPAAGQGRKGTTLAVFEMRRYTGTSLPERDIIGMSRSSDGGITWESARPVIDMSNWGGLPRIQNSVGHPCLATDAKNNTKWLLSLWLPGMNGNTPIENSNTGVTPEKRTGQLLLTHTEDDGKKWSTPENITKHVKKSDDRVIAPASANGIVTTDGILVFPVRTVDRNGKAQATILYRHLNGNDWTIGNRVSSDVASALIVEMADKQLLMILSHNNLTEVHTAVSDDLGKTWKESSLAGSKVTSGGGNISAVRIEASRNFLQQDIIVMCSKELNENGNKQLVLRASIDRGKNWPEKYRMVLDNAECPGNSSLTVINGETLGLLYEGSTAEVVYETIRLKDLFKID